MLLCGGAKASGKTYKTVGAEVVATTFSDASALSGSVYRRANRQKNAVDRDFRVPIQC